RSGQRGSVAYALTHPRKSPRLPLVERLVEARERGADRGGGGANGGRALAHNLHPAARGGRGLGGAGGGERVGGFERRGDELVERNALRRAQPHGALGLTHRPGGEHGGQVPPPAGPAGARLGATRPPWRGRPA